MNGLFTFGRFSVGWNFHRDRSHRTIALPAAVSVDQNAFYVFIGPVTFLWLRKVVTWTRIRPTVPGFYWWRSRDGLDPEVVELTSDLRISQTGTWQDPSNHGNAGEWLTYRLKPPLHIDV